MIRDRFMRVLYLFTGTPLTPTIVELHHERVSVEFDAANATPGITVTADEVVNAYIVREKDATLRLLLATDLDAEFFMKQLDLLNDHLTAFLVQRDSAMALGNAKLRIASTKATGVLP